MTTAPPSDANARIRFIATCGGLGFVSRAPGTIGSLPPLVGAVALLALGVDLRIVVGTQIATALSSGALCLVLGAMIERAWKRPDPPQCVIDEVCGQAVALAMVPWSPSLGRNVAMAIGAFVLFRLFDIWKPWPIGPLQRLPGAWGILFDDVAAGVVAGLALLVIHWTAASAGVIS